MNQHQLKIWPQYFEAVASGAKTFEVRATEDRTFAEGDQLHLREWSPAIQDYTGRELHRLVSYTLTEGVTWGGKPAAILGLASDHAAEVSALRERVAELESAVLESIDAKNDAVSECVSERDIMVASAYETIDSLRAQLEAEKAELETVRAESVEAHDANTALRSELADLKYFYRSRVEGEPRTIVPTSFKGNVQTVEAQLTAQPEGGLREAAQNILKWYSGANPIYDNLKAAECYSVMAKLAQALTTPAASTPPEGKVRCIHGANCYHCEQTAKLQALAAPAPAQACSICGGTKDAPNEVYTDPIEPWKEVCVHPFHKEAPAPACKCGGCKRIWSPLDNCSVPCPDCNAGEGEK